MSTSHTHADHCHTTSLLLCCVCDSLLGTWFGLKIAKQLSLIRRTSKRSAPTTPQTHALRVSQSNPSSLIQQMQMHTNPHLQPSSFLGQLYNSSQRAWTRFSRSTPNTRKLPSDTTEITVMDSRQLSDQAQEEEQRLSLLKDQ
jgi:hypothetical protein